MSLIKFKNTKKNNSLTTRKYSLKLINCSSLVKDKCSDLKKLIKKEPNTLFIFDDNVDRKGSAGSSCIRSSPNAFGLIQGIRIILNGKKTYRNFESLDEKHSGKKVKNLIDEDIDNIINAYKNNLNNKGSPKKGDNYDSIKYCGEKGKFKSVNFYFLNNKSSEQVGEYLQTKLNYLNTELLKFTKKKTSSKNNSKTHKNSNKKHKNNKKKTKKNKTYSEDEIEKICKESNFQYIDVQRDGTCLFHSLIKTYLDDNNIKKRNYEEGRQVRYNILKHISKNLNSYIDSLKFFLEHDIQIGPQNTKNDKEIIDYYTKYMEKNSTYGGEIEILAFSDMMKVNIMVHIIQNGKLNGRYINKFNKSNKTIHLFHHLPREHYSALFEIKPSNKPTTAIKTKLAIKNNPVVKPKNLAINQINTKFSKKNLINKYQLELDKILTKAVMKKSQYESKIKEYDILIKEINTIINSKKITQEDLDEFKAKFNSLKHN